MKSNHYQLKVSQSPDYVSEAKSRFAIVALTLIELSKSKAIWALVLLIFVLVGGDDFQIFLRLAEILIGEGQ